MQCLPRHECSSSARKSTAGLPESPYEEIDRQNRELLKTLQELRARQEELALLNRELEDTNRGVVALYAELDERADYLRRASELKTSFLSNISHEFRTPLNSIMSLARILLDRLDGDLTGEQETQVGFILESAKTLAEMVNDLLDLAKVEAGKVKIRVKTFEVAELFSALKGMLKPLLADNTSVDLVFLGAENLPALRTDEGKVSQILRNFISNAIKFTPQGEIRIAAEQRGGAVLFEVADTGIGIPPENQETVFQEFVQVENPLQGRYRGTGLGLPLCRKMAYAAGRQGLGKERIRPWIEFLRRTAHYLQRRRRRGRAPSEEMPAPEFSRSAVLLIETDARCFCDAGTGVSNIRISADPRGEPGARGELAAATILPVVVICELNSSAAWEFLRFFSAGSAGTTIPFMAMTTAEGCSQSAGTGRGICR